MPWKETCAMHEKNAFINAWLSREFNKSELCRRFGVSRPTGDKWICRFCQEGLKGLEDRSRAPHHPGNKTPDQLVKQILKVKFRYPTWGSIPIRDLLLRQQPDEAWPAVSTFGEILKRHGLVKRRKKRHRMPPHSQPLQHATSPNAVWSADFKGDFPMGNGRRCYPLTISDNYSRYLIDCKGQYGIHLKPVKGRYEQAFRTYGLPDVIRTDNGYPFAQLSLGGLSPLSIWLLKLGILPERIAPGCPQQNPRHERMHRTLKEATANPPKGNLSAQQRAFNRFRYEYNEQRTHQGLKSGQRPIDVYTPSSRAFPEQLPEVQYPDDFDVRKVRYGGWIRCHGPEVYASRQLMGEYVGLQRINEDLYQIYFAQLLLGIVDRRLGRIIRPDRSHL
jgi:transposase InsO family protein